MNNQIVLKKNQFCFLISKSFLNLYYYSCKFCKNSLKKLNFFSLIYYCNLVKEKSKFLSQSLILLVFCLYYI